jgi:hypothetical protein
MAWIWLLVGCATNGGNADGLVLNELLARNAVTNTDDAGEFDDWVEIFNGGTEPIALTGLHLSDDAAAPARWPFPEGDPLEPGAYLLVWCDGQPEQGDFHAPFKLGGNGESVLLSYIEDGAPTTLDAVDYTEQTADVAWARVPDGGIEWVTATPTPGDTNGG